MAKRARVNTVAGEIGEQITMSFMVDSDVDAKFNAFGLHMTYDPSYLRFDGVKRGEALADWASVDGHEAQAGAVTIGGFAGAGTTLSVFKQAILFHAVFRVVAKGACVTTFDDYVDHLVGFEPAVIEVKLWNGGNELTADELDEYTKDTLANDRGWLWTTGSWSWDDQCHYRGVHVKHDYQVADFEPMYAAKQDRLIAMLREMEQGYTGMTPEDRRQLEQKIIRIADKWKTARMEDEGREKGFFDRDPVGTLYYIDLDGGDDGLDGLTFGNAWLTIEKYTTVESRSPGDIAYVRANTSEIPVASIQFDEDGNKDSLISIIGCDSIVNDPWSDSSDVKSIVDFNSNAYLFALNGDSHWYFERLDIKSSSSVGIDAQMGSSLWLKSCVVRDSSDGVQCRYNSYLNLEDCEIDNNSDDAVYGEYGGSIDIINTVVNGPGSYGLRNRYGSIIYMTGGSLGQANAFTIDDVRPELSSNIYLRDVVDNNDYYIGYYNTALYIEDKDGVKGSHYFLIASGSITKDTSVVRSGGADSSAKFEPTSGVGTYRPLSFNDESIIDFPFEVECFAAIEKTVTVYLKADAAWSPYPTNTQLYLEFEYLDGVSGASRTATASTEVLSDTNWTAFTVTFTPALDGVAYGNVYLKLYEASRSVYVDMMAM